MAMRYEHLESVHGGHWGFDMMDPGVVKGSYKEAVIADRFARKIIAITGARNAGDRSGRTVSQNLVNIGHNVDRKTTDDDYHISIHLNGAADHSATGVEVFHYGQAEKALAAKISKDIANTLGIKDRGAKLSKDAPGGGLYVVDQTRGHMLLIELCFLTNDNDMKQLLAKEDEVVSVIVGAFGFKTTTSPEIKPVKPPVESNTGIKPDVWYDEIGTFKIGSDIGIWLQKKPVASPNYRIIALPKNSEVHYDKVMHSGGYVWIRQPRADGSYGYMATGRSDGTKRIKDEDGNLFWGEFYARK